VRRGCARLGGKSVGKVCFYLFRSARGDAAAGGRTGQRTYVTDEIVNTHTHHRFRRRRRYDGVRECQFRFPGDYHNLYDRRRKVDAVVVSYTADGDDAHGGRMLMSGGRGQTLTLSSNRCSHASVWENVLRRPRLPIHRPVGFLACPFRQHSGCLVPP